MDLTGYSLYLFIETSYWLEEIFQKIRRTERRNGQWAVDDTGHNQGNYTDVYRANLLRRLLETQREVQETKPHVELISSQELIAIQVTWYRDAIFDFKVSDIYNRVYGRDISVDDLKYREKIILEKVCRENPNDYRLINELCLCKRVRLYL